jgi:hypothetical protein
MKTSHPLRVAVCGLAVVATVALAWACTGDDPTPPTCTDVPAGGCPSSFGPACDDPSCAAVYECTATGAWSLLATCPARDGGPDGGIVDAAKDAPPPRDVEIDVPGANGGPGCQDLQPPDCTLGFGLACPSGQCCGCEDFFVCVSGGWNQWGTCGDGGSLVPR